MIAADPFTMPLIAPFTGLRPAPGRAAELLAPPYDVMDAAAARALVAGRPWSFLHLSRPEVDFPADRCPVAPVCFAQAATTLARMQAAGLLRRDARPCYYCYRLIRGAQVQTGLVLAASLAAYRTGRIRRHEVTLTAKEEDRVLQIAALNAQTGPALLIHRRLPQIDDTLAAITQGEPDVDVLAADGVRHTLWSIADQPPILGIGDPRQDPRIDFVGGIRGLEGLMQPVDSGAMRLAFSLHPTALSDLIAVADRGETLPPKCTWFETKLADGMVSLVLD